MNHKIKIKTILLDMDGVLWRGPEPALDIQLLFDSIQELGLRVFCVTNNSTRLIDYYLERFAGYGVFLDQSQIITSAEATGEYIENKLPQRGHLFVIGEQGLMDVLSRKGFELLEKEGSEKIALAVVVGLDRNMTYADLAMAVRHIHDGALFVGTNPDLTFPTPSGPEPGAGTIIKAVEFSSGVTPWIIGKPFPALYSTALKRAGSLPEETLMIGDRLETDILGAQQMGIRTALVLSGIASRKQAKDWEPAPDIIADTALQVVERIREKNEKPL